MILPVAIYSIFWRRWRSLRRRRKLRPAPASARARHDPCAAHKRQPRRALPQPPLPPPRRQPRRTPPAAAPVQTADPFGEPLTLEPKKVVIVKGNANWDSAFDTLINSFKALTTFLDKQGIKAPATR